MANIRFGKTIDPIIAGPIQVYKIGHDREEVRADICINSRNLEIWIRLTASEVQYILEVLNGRRTS